MNYSKKFIYKNALNNKPLLLFIHGAGSDYTFWSNINRYFYFNQYSTLSINLPGHGKNFDKPLDSIESMTNYITNLVKKFRHKSIIPIGHSMGSLICLSLAAKKDIDIKKTILIGTSMPMKVSSYLLELSKKDQSLAINNMVNWSLPSTQKLGGGQFTGISLPNYVYNLMNKTKKGVLYRDLKACNNYILEEKSIKNINLPVLIISGRQDIMTPKKSSINLKNILPDAKIEILNQCGHLHTFEYPNIVRELIKNFLAND